MIADHVMSGAVSDDVTAAMTTWTLTRITTTRPTSAIATGGDETKKSPMTRSEPKTAAVTLRRASTWSDGGCRLSGGAAKSAAVVVTSAVAIEATVQILTREIAASAAARGRAIETRATLADVTGVRAPGLARARGQGHASAHRTMRMETMTRTTGVGGVILETKVPRPAFDVPTL